MLGLPKNKECDQHRGNEHPDNIGKEALQIAPAIFP